MAAPLVAGTAALMFEANPTLTPNLIKALLMYTAQQLPNFNLLEQGAGELNVDGAVRLAKLVRTTITSSTSLGASLLTSSAPAAQTTIAIGPSAKLEVFGYFGGFALVRTGGITGWVSDRLTD